jgi:hypothetical protein
MLIEINDSFITISRLKLRIDFKVGSFEFSLQLKLFSSNYLKRGIII